MRQFRAAWILLMIVSAVIGGAANAQQPSGEETPERLVLARLVGDWDLEISVTRNQWMPNGAKAHGTSTNKWVGDGSVLRSTWTVQYDDGKPMFNGTTEFTYDTKSRTYRAAGSWSTGMTSESTGSWDGKSGVMSWTTRDPNTKLATITKSNLSRDGFEKWTMVIADPKLGTVFEWSGTNTRRNK